MSVIQTAEIVLPSDPVSIKRIKDYCEELSGSMSRVEGERDFQKEATDELSKDVDIPKKYLKKIASLYHKSNKDVVESEQESISELYDKVFSVEINEE